MDERIRRAREIAPLLVGLPIRKARRQVEAIPELRLHETTVSDGVYQTLAFGRVTVVVDNGRVIEAFAG